MQTLPCRTRRLSSDGDALFSECNRDCSCSAEEWDPVCSDRGITYVSPCMAGCLSSSGYGKNTVGLHTWMHKTEHIDEFFRKTLAPKPSFGTRQPIVSISISVSKSFNVNCRHSLYFLSTTVNFFLFNCLFILYYVELKWNLIPSRCHFFLLTRSSTTAAVCPPQQAAARP